MLVDLDRFISDPTEHQHTTVTSSASGVACLGDAVSRAQDEGLAVVFSKLAATRKPPDTDRRSEMGAEESPAALVERPLEVHWCSVLTDAAGEAVSFTNAATVGTGWCLDA